MVTKKKTKEEKEFDVKILDLNASLQFLKESDIDYITKEGAAFIDGINLAGAMPKFYHKEKVDKYIKETKEAADKHVAHLNYLLSESNEEINILEATVKELNEGISGLQSFKDGYHELLEENKQSKKLWYKRIF